MARQRGARNRIVFVAGSGVHRPENAVAVRCHIEVVTDLHRANAEPGVVYRCPADTLDPSNRWTVRNFGRRVELPCCQPRTDCVEPEGDGFALFIFVDTRGIYPMKTHKFFTGSI